MKALEFFGVTAAQVTTHAAHAIKIEGQFLGAVADRYLQAHDSAAAPAANAVPLRQWPIAQGAQFFQTFSAGELALTKGLYVCVSTTDGTYTLSADIMDVTVELTDPELPSGLSIAGDLVNTTNALQVWADGAGPLRLVTLEVDGTGLSADSWLHLVTQTIGANPAPKILASYPLPIGKLYTGTKALRFGNEGRDMFAITPADGVAHNGCVAYISTQQYNVTLDAGNRGLMRAEYK